MSDSLTSSANTPPHSGHQTSFHPQSRGSGPSASIPPPPSASIKFKMPEAPGAEMNQFAMELFINSLNLALFAKLDMDGKQRHVESFDAAEMFYALQEIDRTLAAVKLENHYLIDFLERNDPKLLIGLKQRRATASFAHRRLTITSATSERSSVAGTATATATQSASATPARRGSSRRSIMTTALSIFTTTSTKRSDFRLNFRAKADMAEKCAMEVEKRINTLERYALTTIRNLNGRAEELAVLVNETRQTSDNFDLHFRRDERDLRWLATATERQIERKFRKFVANWSKNALALISMMQLRIHGLQETSQQHRSDLITKGDLAGLLSAVDFEKMYIKRTMLIAELEEKNNHMGGLKAVTAKAALAMTEEKSQMMAIEDESKRIASKMVDVIRSMAKQDREADAVEELNQKDLKKLTKLKEQLAKYTAPTVSTYISKKDELVALEKEQKLLIRKVNILQMKLTSLQKQCKMRG